MKKKFSLKRAAPSRRLRRSKTRRPIAKDLHVVGHGVSGVGERFVKLVFKGQPVLVSVNNLLTNRLAEFVRLQNHGARLLRIEAQRKLVAKVDCELANRPKFSVVTTTGWHGDVFVFPDGIVPTGRSDIEIHFADEGADRYQRLTCHGTETGAKELFALFKGNTRLMTGVALAFVGPLGIVCPLEHVGLQYCGANGVGKSSAAAAVSSIWGGDANPNHRLGSGTAWKNTDNALEQYSTAYSNTLLFLDEADSIVGGDNKAKANALLNVVKDIAGGRGKGRANDPSVSSWFTPILSTSNLSVPRMLELKRRDRDFSYIDRLFDIPPPKNAHGFFENLHGFADKVEFRDRLLELANRNFGVTGRAFVAEIARSLKRDRTGLVAFVRARREAYHRAAASIPAPGRDLGRLHGKFATIYAAGCVAIRFKILPFKRNDLLRAVLKCERDHVEFVRTELGLPHDRAKTIGSPSAFERLKDRLFGPTRLKLIDLRKPGARPPQGHIHTRAAGYLGRHLGRDEIWLRNKRLERMVGGKAEATALKLKLHRKRLIVSERRGKTHNFVVKRDIPGVGRLRVVALRPPPPLKRSRRR